MTNKKEIASAARLFEKYYKDILKALSKGDYPQTVSILRKAKAKRDKFIYGKSS